MPADGHAIDRPAPLAVRVIALGFLEEAERARLALLDGTDPEALHDVRVALRRLRSCLRAYAPQLEDSVRRRDRRRLRKIAAATGAARDLEVQLQNLAALERPSDAEHTALEWLIGRREEARAVADERVRRTLTDAFPAVRARLTRRLTAYRTRFDPADPDASPPTLGFVASGVITVLGARLEAGLAAVRTESDQRTAHAARIAGKRLRYVLEPLRHGLPAAATLVDDLRALQDLLGDMHDADVMHRDIAHVLASPEPVAGPVAEGLRALLERFAEERSARFADVSAAWLGSAATPFLEAVHTVARRLRAARPAGIEIERKYLLDGMPRMGRKHVRFLTIDQGWLPGERLRERVRRVRDRDGTRWYRTVKLGSGVRRIEIEEETTREVFGRLWRLTAGRRVHKRRCVREHEGLLWEVDRFTDRDLVLAEVELPATDTAVTLPPWLARHVVREVTDDPAYVNFNLAK